MADGKDCRHLLCPLSGQGPDQEYPAMQATKASFRHTPCDGATLDAKRGELRGGHDSMPPSSEIHDGPISEAHGAQPDTTGLLLRRVATCTP